MVAAGVMLQMAVKFIVLVDVVMQHDAAGCRVDLDLLYTRDHHEGFLDLLEQFGIGLGRTDLHADPARYLMRDLQFHLGH